MLTRTPPTVADLVARALTATPFLREATGATSHDMRISAELCAELAAEDWEREHGAITGAAVPWELSADVANGLVAHALSRRAANDNALYQSHAKLERTLAAVAAAKCGIKGTLPVDAAEAMLDDIETHFAHIRVALTRALAILGKEIDLIERAALREAV
jgi:hypothetical protein